MQISRNIVNGLKSNTKVLVGTWVIVCIQNYLTTFCRPFVHYAVRMFKIVFRDNSLYPKQLSLFLSSKADRRKR